jgi:hypothetical protein
MCKPSHPKPKPAKARKDQLLDGRLRSKTEAPGQSLTRYHWGSSKIYLEKGNSTTSKNKSIIVSMEMN